MKKLENKIIGTFAVMLLMSSAAFAQQDNRREKPKNPPTVEQILKDLDSNEDGKISLEEAKGPLKNDFKKIDTNEDGFISEKELKDAPKPAGKEKLKN